MLGIHSFTYIVLGEREGSMKKIKIVLIVIITILPSVVFASGSLVISKSVFVQLAEPNTHAFQENKFTYFPAGTRLIKGNTYKEYRGSMRQLVFSENGIAAYIKEGMYWNSDQIKYLRQQGGDKWVFITRQKDVVAKISDEVKLIIGFSRGEKYPLVEESEDFFTVKVGKNKISRLGKSVNYEITLPRKNGNLVDLSKQLSLRDAAIYKLSVIDGISGIKKPCNTKTAKATKYGGSLTSEVGFSLKKFWLALRAKGEVNASTETSKLEEFDENMNVSREYYTKNYQIGVYKLTRYKSCSGNQVIKYIYTNKDIDEITISREWAKKTAVAFCDRTGQVLITCPQQYFAYYDELLEWAVDSEEIPFVIANTAKFKSLTSPECIKP